MTNTSKFQGKMKENNLTIKTLANKISLSPTGLFNKIHNQKEFLCSEVQMISDIFRLTDDEIQQIFFAKNVE